MSVAVTDTERVLGFVGIGSDHHALGGPISNPLTRQAIATGTVVFADGVHQRYHCALAEGCPLDQAVALYEMVAAKTNREVAARAQFLIGEIQLQLSLVMLRSILLGDLPRQGLPHCAPLALQPGRRL